MISLGHILLCSLFMGVVLGSAVVPIAIAVAWSKANKNGCILGSIAGFFAGIIAWLVTTSALNNGVITISVGGLIMICAGLFTDHNRHEDQWG
jgi:Na+/proline symporter